VHTSRMASSQYSTLSLDAPSAARKKNTGLYVLTGVAVIALVGVAAFAAVGQGRVTTVDNAQFDKDQGTVVNCDDSSATFINDLPWYDAQFSADPIASKLANACYYSFRCCTTLQGDCGEGDDVGMGNACRTCLESNPPRSVNRDCRLFYEKKIAISATEEVSCKDGNGQVTDTSVKIDARCENYLVGNPTSYTLQDLQRGKVPQFTNNKFFSNKFGNMQTCWTRGGGGTHDQPNPAFTNKYAEQCFEIFQWCNQMCPRDDDNSIQHQYCKNCFQASTEAAFA